MPIAPSRIAASPSKVIRDAEEATFMIGPPADGSRAVPSPFDDGYSSSSASSVCRWSQTCSTAGLCSSNPLDAKYHWGGAAIQMAFSVFLLTETWLVPVEGYLVDRYGPKPVVMAGGILCGTLVDNELRRRFAAAACMPPPRWAGWAQVRSTGPAWQRALNGFPTGPVWRQA